MRTRGIGALRHGRLRQQLEQASDEGTGQRELPFGDRAMAAARTTVRRAAWLRAHRRRVGASARSRPRPHENARAVAAYHDSMHLPDRDQRVVATHEPGRGQVGRAKYGRIVLPPDPRSRSGWQSRRPRSAAAAAVQHQELCDRRGSARSACRGRSATPGHRLRAPGVAQLAKRRAGKACLPVSRR